MHRLTDPVNRRRALEFAADAVLAALAFALAFTLRFLDDGGQLPDRYQTMLLGSVAFVGHRQGARDRALRAPPAVVALLPAPRPVAAVPRARGRDRADGPGLRAGEALLVQPAALGDHPRLHPRLRAARRRPARPPLARRAPDAPGARRRRVARGAGGRRRLRRADGGPRAEAQSEPRRPGDRLPRRRPPQARDAHRGPEGARDDRRDRPRARPPEPRRGRDRDPVGARRPARQGGRRVPRARHPGAHPADRLRAPARRRPAHPPAARGPGRGRARAATPW